MLGASWLGRLFLARLVASPAGRAFLLGFMADAEESDEAGVFDALLARVDDRKLHAMVRHHAADEERHARLLHGAVARQGVAPGPMPQALRYVLRVGAMLPDGADPARASVMETYVLLGLIEERAVREWPAIVAALAPVDPESSEVVARIVEDERRHVRTSWAVARRYAPDEATLRRTEREYRAVEARAFAAHQRAFLSHAVAHDLLSLGRLERPLWRLAAA